MIIVRAEQNHQIRPLYGWKQVYLGKLKAAKDVSQGTVRIVKDWENLVSFEGVCLGSRNSLEIRGLQSSSRSQLHKFLRTADFRLCWSVSNPAYSGQSSAWAEPGLSFMTLSMALSFVGPLWTQAMILSEHGPALAVYVFSFLLFSSYSFLVNIYSFRHGDYKFEWDRYALSCHSGFKKKEWQKD